MEEVQNCDLVGRPWFLCFCPHGHYELRQLVSELVSVLSQQHRLRHLPIQTHAHSHRLQLAVIPKRVVRNRSQVLDLKCISPSTAARDGLLTIPLPACL
jgi:hypothetical protein